MFSRSDRYRDTLAAGLALLGIAAVLTPIILWLSRGLVAAGHDLDTIENPRTQGDITIYGGYLYAVAALLAAAAIASLGLGLWLILAGAAHHRRLARSRVGPRHRAA